MVAPIAGGAIASSAITSGGLQTDSLSAETGEFTFIGYDASILFGPSIIAETGVFTYTGSDVPLLKQSLLTAETGAFTYTGYDVSFVSPTIPTLVAETGYFTYYGYNTGSGCPGLTSTYSIGATMVQTVSMTTTIASTAPRQTRLNSSRICS